MSEDSIRLDVYFTPPELSEKSVKGKRMVVVDVLRFCTTISYALSNGAELIIPVVSNDDVARLATSLDRKEVLLCGKRIDGYELSNSPEEYLPAKVEGKTLLMTTNNGPESVARCEGAKEIVLAALVNLGAVVDYLAKRSEWTLLCSGRNGQFALEDALCAGAIVSRLREKGLMLDVNDAGRSAEFLYRSAVDDLTEIMKGTEAGIALTRHGLGRDVEVCSQVDTIPVVPIVHDGRIRKP